ncbi:MAG: MBL fold metallo-hydrolase, partial [Candidatus Glassbacteria bacterium]|nr:MBL fold metallo-hydrolase [Candidatus Glassbacteria bacterium]
MLPGCAPGQGPPAIRVVEDFPFDPGRSHEGDFTPTGGWSRLSENLYRLEDCCNVYVLKHENSALLVDFGSGRVLEHLKEIGVDKVDRVLVTHHHRDQVQGLCDLEDYGFQVDVPAGEARFFEDVESFWSSVKIYINYNCRSHWNTIRRSIRVGRKVAGGDLISWNGTGIKVIDT